MNKLIDSDWGYLILSAFVDYVYYLGWGVIALISLYLLLKYIVKPLMSECFQQKTKKNAFEQEKFWAFFNRMEKPVQEELEKAKEELKKSQRKQEEYTQREESVKQKEKELQERESNLEKDEKDFEVKILESKVKAYEEIIKKS